MISLDKLNKEAKEYAQQLDIKATFYKIKENYKWLLKIDSFSLNFCITNSKYIFRW